MERVSASGRPPAVSAVPHRLRLLCALLAAVVVVVGVFVALSLPSQDTGVSFGTADQVAVAGIGVLLAAGIVALGRARVDADAEGIRIRNVVGGRELPWSAVRAVRFERSSWWATLRLGNDDEIAVLAVQSIDGERAVAAVEGLRALLAAARAAEPPPAPEPPLLYRD
ncbi:PH domain-containing protein [Blastococcus sp. SYSU D00820]